MKRSGVQVIPDPVNLFIYTCAATQPNQTAYCLCTRIRARMYKLKYKHYRSEGEGRTEDAIAMR